MSSTTSIDQERSRRVPPAAPAAPPAPSRWRRIASWGPWPVVVAVTPLVVLLVLQLLTVLDDSVPAADWAVLELRTRATLRTENLLGPYSRFQWSHPGPAMFLVMSPFYRLTGDRFSGLVVSVLLVHTVSIGIVVGAVRHAFGRSAAWIASLACLAFIWRFGLERFRDPWNPYWVVTPLAALVMLAAVAWVRPRPWRGRWLLPVVVVVASLALQTHVGSAPVVAVSGLGALSGVLYHTRNQGLRAQLWAVGPALVVAAVLWAPTFYEQTTRDPGNLGELVLQLRTQSGHHGLADVSDLAVPALSPIDGRAGQHFGPASPFLARPSASWPSAVAIGAGALVLLAGARRSLRRREWAPERAAVALIPLAAAVAAVLATRQALGPLHPYLLTPVVGVSLAWWVACGLHVGWRAQRTLKRSTVARLTRWLPRLAVASLAAVLVASAHDLSTAATSFADRWEPSGMDHVQSELEREVCPIDGDVLQLEMRGSEWIDAVAVAAALERCDQRVRFPGGLAYVVGQRATVEPAGTPAGYVVMRARGDEGASGERFLGRAGSGSVWFSDEPPPADEPADG